MSQAMKSTIPNLSRRNARALRIRLVNERSRSPEPLPALLPHEATGHSGLDTMKKDQPKPMKKDQPKLDPLSVTVRQACALTGLSRSMIYNLNGEGRLRSFKVGRRTLITYASLRGLLEAAAH
jgi:excisionase family DNA binding protein